MTLLHFCTHVLCDKICYYLGIILFVQYGHPAAGGVEHVPPGWDNWYGLVCIFCLFEVL